MTSLRPLPAPWSDAYRDLVNRCPAGDATVSDAVALILDQVRSGGDLAIRTLTERFDGVRVGTSRVLPAEWQVALDSLAKPVRAAMEEAARRIEMVHRAQAFREAPVTVVPGVRVWREWRPFRRVGIYAPGGRSVYPSSVLMMAVPARLAGCAEIVLCSPPQRDGRIAPAMLAAAAIAGVTEVHAVGGAQAIAGLAYGTETIARVDKIFGPGNAFVTEAKRQVFGEVGIDMPAGPSEVVVISDGSADPQWLAADLRAQAEHSPDALAVLLTTSDGDAAALESMPEEQVRAFRCASIEEALAFSNDFAPEHLSLACREPEGWLSQVTSAGSVFLGPYAPAAAGDYATGANHVLPTGGAARAFGALGLGAFGRPIQVQAIEQIGIAAVASVVDPLAAVEELPWHAASVRARLDRGGNRETRDNSQQKGMGGDLNGDQAE